MVDPIPTKDITTYTVESSTGGQVLGVTSGGQVALFSAADFGGGGGGAATFIYLYANNSATPATSLFHQGASVFVVNDMAYVEYYSVSVDPRSGGWMRCYEVRGAPYGGTVGTLTYDSSNGGRLLLEGLNHRWLVVATDGNRIDIRRYAIPCIEAQTGWHSRFTTMLQYYKNRFDAEMVASGVMSCTETVFLDRVIWRNPFLRFQGGTAAPNGGVVGPPTFYTQGATSANTAVTVTAGTPVNVAHTAHGFSANQQLRLGVEPQGKIAGGLSVLTTYFVIVVDANNYNLATSSGGAAVNSATAGIAGQVYAFYSTAGLALPSQSNVTTQDYIRWDGKIERTGVVVRGASNGSNKDMMQQDITVWGDGNSDHTTPPSTTNVKLEDDDSANGVYNLSVNYSAVGVAIAGPAEKYTLNVRGIYNRIVIYVPKDSSTDTMHIIHNGQDNQAHYYEHDGVDTSVTLDLRIESRDDPSTDAGSWGADAPAILVRNGKFTKIMGDMRGGNGLRTILLWGVTNALGTVARRGMDTCEMDVHLVQGSGIAFEARAIIYLTGKVSVRSWGNAVGPLAQNCPAIIMGRVMHARNFETDGFGINNYRGVQFGTSAAGGYYSSEVHLGRHAMDMGTVLYQFNTAGTVQTGAAGNPTTLLAAVVEKWNAATVDLSGTRGKIQLDVDCVNGKVMVDPVMASVYTNTNNSTGTTIVTVP